MISKQLGNEWILFLLNCRDADYSHVSKFRTSTDQRIYYDHLKHADLLEHGVLLISRFLSLKDGIGDRDQKNVIDDVVITLNDLAQKLRDCLQSFKPLHKVSQQSTTTNHGGCMSNGTVCCTEESEESNPGGTYTVEYVKNAVTILNTIITAEFGDLRNTNEYKIFTNLSIASILSRSVENRVKGIPILIAIIYKLILSRVNIHTEIIGLADHVVLGVPINKNFLGNKNAFVDVYNECRFLSKADCQGVMLQGTRGLQSFLQVHMGDSYIVPRNSFDTNCFHSRISIL